MLLQVEWNPQRWTIFLPQSGVVSRIPELSSTSRRPSFVCMSSVACRFLEVTRRGYALGKCTGHEYSLILYEPQDKVTLEFAPTRPPPPKQSNLSCKSLADCVARLCRWITHAVQCKSKDSTTQSSVSSLYSKLLKFSLNHSILIV